MIVLQIAEISSLQKLEIYKLKMDKSKTIYIKILKYKICLLYCNIWLNSSV